MANITFLTYWSWTCPCGFVVVRPSHRLTDWAAQSHDDECCHNLNLWRRGQEYERHVLPVRHPSWKAPETAAAPRIAGSRLH